MISRRGFLRSIGITTCVVAVPAIWVPETFIEVTKPQFTYTSHSRLLAYMSHCEQVFIEELIYGVGNISWQTRRDMKYWDDVCKELT